MVFASPNLKVEHCSTFLMITIDKIKDFKMNSYEEYVLEGLLLPYKREVCQEIEIFLQNNASDICVADPIEMARYVGDYCVSEMIGISIRAQNSMRKEIFGNFLNNDKEYYDWAITDEAKNFMKNRYPELVRILDVKKKKIVSLFKTVINRFMNDQCDLKAHGFPVSAGLLEFIISGGDYHRGGQCVCILQTSVGKIVYKPRSLSIDNAVYQIATIVNKNLSFGKGYVEIPKSLDCGSYGWQDFVEYIPAKTIEELSGYYKSLGGLTAFFASLGALDLHYENISIVGNKAVPLDLETSMGTLQTTQQAYQGEGILGVVNRVIACAGVNTLILPPLARGKRFDVDLSPITDGNSQKSKLMYSLTYEIGAEGAASMQESNITKKALYSGNLTLEETHPRKQMSNFLQGYKNVRDAILNCKQDLISLLEDFPNISNRCIIRPTATYGAFLDTSYHPKYLVSCEKRSDLFKRLKLPAGLPEWLGEDVLKVEIKDLLDGDIPYFTDDFLKGLGVGNDIDRTVDNPNDADIFRVAPVESLQKFSDVPYNVISYIQHGAFAGIDTDIENIDQEITPFFSLDISSTWSMACYDLASQVQELVLESNEEELSILLMHSVDMNNRIHTAPLDANYYEGQGALWILHELVQLTKNTNVSETISSLLRFNLQSLPHLPFANISGFTGLFSQIQIGHLVSEYIDSDSEKYLITNIIKKAKQMLDSSEASKALDMDYISGLAGALALLGNQNSRLSLYKDSQSLREKLHVLVASAFMKDQLEDFVGVAHGPTGLVLGLIRGGISLSHDEIDVFREKLKKRVMFEIKEADNYPPEARQAWCSGVPGIAETFAYVLDATGGLSDHDQEILVKLFREFQHDLDLINGPADISLCHGIAGSLAAWYRIACLLPDLHLSDDIRFETEKLRQRLLAGELEIRGGVRHATSSLCTMLGMSGAVLALSKIEKGQKFADFLSF